MSTDPVTHVVFEIAFEWTLIFVNGYCSKAVKQPIIWPFASVGAILDFDSSIWEEVASLRIIIRGSVAVAHN